MFKKLLLLFGALALIVTMLTLGAAPAVAATPTAAITEAAPPQLPASCHEMTAHSNRHICVVKGEGSRATLYAIENGGIVRTLPARTGDLGGPDSVTKVGSFKLFKKDADHKTLDKGLPMPYAMFFYQGQAVHGSTNFEKFGYAGGRHSDGCVNLKVRDAEWLFNWMPLGNTINVVGKP